MTTLAQYEVEVADLLHDPNHQYWTLVQLDRYINEARRQLVADTGCLRTLQASYFTQAQESYIYGQVMGASIVVGGSGYAVTDTITFTGGGGTGVAATLGVSSGAVTAVSFSSFGSGYTSAPSVSITTAAGTSASVISGIVSANTLDILGINCTWGNAKFSMKWKVWSEFSAILRQQVGMQGRPWTWSGYGESAFYVALIPDQTYGVEIDSVVSPADLTGAAVDPISVSYQTPIKYYAAYRAKYFDQSYGESAMFHKAYEEGVVRTINQVFTRRIPNIYQGTN